MKQNDATAAKNRFGRLLEAVASGPVAVTRHARVVAWVVAPKDFTAATARLGPPACRACSPVASPVSTIPFLASYTATTSRKSATAISSDAMIKAVREFNLSSV